MTIGWPISQEALFNKETNFYYIHCTRHLKAAFRLNKKKKNLQFLVIIYSKQHFKKHSHLLYFETIV